MIAYNIMGSTYLS